jgi:hypothetical protein
MKKPVFILAILILIIAGLLITRTAISNKISTKGVVLGKTQDELIKYKTENVILKEKIFGLSSLTHVASEAARIGFVDGKSNFALTKARPIAALR